MLTKVFLLLSFLPVAFAICGSFAAFRFPVEYQTWHWRHARIIRHFPIITAFMPESRILGMLDSMLHDIKTEENKLKQIKDPIGVYHLFLHRDFISGIYDISFIPSWFYDLEKYRFSRWTMSDTHFLRECFGDNKYNGYYVRDAMNEEINRAVRCEEEGLREMELLINFAGKLRGRTLQDHLPRMLQVMGEIAAEMKALYLHLDIFKLC